MPNPNVRTQVNHALEFRPTRIDRSSCRVTRGTCLLCSAVANIYKNILIYKTSVYRKLLERVEASAYEFEYKLCWHLLMVYHMVATASPNAGVYKLLKTYVFVININVCTRKYMSMHECRRLAAGFTHFWSVILDAMIVELL